MVSLPHSLNKLDTEEDEQIAETIAFVQIQLADHLPDCRLRSVVLRPASQ